MQKCITLAEAYELFMLDGESRGFTRDTLRFYRDRLGIALRWCSEQGIATVQELTATSIKLYLTGMQQRNLSSHYVHSHARAIRTLCRFLVREGLLDVSPFDKVKMPRLEKKILSALTAEKVRLVLRTCIHERDRALLLFMLDTGVRASELCALNVMDVDHEGAVTVMRGKGQKARMTNIGTKTRKALIRYYALERSGRPAPSEPLFISQRGGERLTYSGLGQILKRLRAKTGMHEAGQLAGLVW